MDFYKILGTIRASFTFYNTKAEIDTFVKLLNEQKIGCYKLSCSNIKPIFMLKRLFMKKTPITK